MFKVNSVSIFWIIDFDEWFDFSIFWFFWFFDIIRFFAFKDVDLTIFKILPPKIKNKASNHFL